MRFFLRRTTALDHQTRLHLFVVLNHGIEPRLADLNQLPPSGNEPSVKLPWDFYQ